MAKNPSLVILEIAKKFLVYKNIPLLAQKLVSSERVVDFTDSMLHYKRVKIFFKFDSGCVLLGAGMSITMPEDVQVLMTRSYPNLMKSSCMFYHRMILRGTLFSTSFYSQRKQNNDSCAQNKSGHFIIVKYIMHFGDTNVILVVEKLKETRRCAFKNEYTSINHVRRMERSNLLDCIPYADIGVYQPSMFICVPHDIYVSAIPYGCTIE